MVIGEQETYGSRSGDNKLRAGRSFIRQSRLFMNETGIEWKRVIIDAIDSSLGHLHVIFSS